MRSIVEQHNKQYTINNVPLIAFILMLNDIQREWEHITGLCQ